LRQLRPVEEGLPGQGLDEAGVAHDCRRPTMTSAAKTWIVSAGPRPDGYRGPPHVLVRADRPNRGGSAF
jgi:hypothetical protein